MVTAKFSRSVACRKCAGYREALEQEEKLCSEAEIIKEFSYLGDRVCAFGGCEVAMVPEKDVVW